MNHREVLGYDSNNSPIYPYRPSGYAVEVMVVVASRAREIVVLGVAYKMDMLPFGSAKA